MYDILIRNGRVVDGTGAPARNGSLAIQDGVHQLEQLRVVHVSRQGRPRPNNPPVRGR